MAAITKIGNTKSGVFDYEIVNGQLLTGNDYASVLINALFTADQATAFGYDAWWANSYVKYPIASDLVLLVRAVKSGANNILLLAQNYATQALAPLVRMGVFSSVSVTCSWISGNGTTAIQFNITITLPNSNSQQFYKYGLNPYTGTSFTIV